METVSGNLIDPIYQQDAPNAPIPLGSHRARIISGSLDKECLIEAEMRFTPRDSIRFVTHNIEADTETAFQSWATQNNTADKDCVEFKDRGVTIPVITTQRNFTPRVNSLIEMTPKRSPVILSPDTDHLHEAVCHLFNFPDFFGTSDYISESATTTSSTLQSSTRCGRAHLEHAGWQFTLAALHDTAERYKKLRQAGGFFLTHMIKVVRTDSELFSSKDLQQQLRLLCHFLSFAIGRWAGLAFTRAYDANAQVSWEDWGMRWAHRDIWTSSFSWFDPHHGTMLQDVFPGFVRLWNTPLWNEPLSHAIYSYIAANVSQEGLGVDARLILAQTALEILAWTHCVQSKRMVSSNAFTRKGLSAADRLRLLLSSCGIPKDIPNHMSALHSKRGRPWEDGPDAITSIRNQLVHPGNPSRLPPDSFYEVCMLSLWYIELAILHIAGYSGQYSNRLRSKPSRIGEVEPVPWNHAEADQ